MKIVQFYFHQDLGQVVDVPVPIPTVDHPLRVKVAYSAIDTGVDVVLSKSAVGQFIHKYEEPLSLGWHYAGVVDALGEDYIISSKGKDDDLKVGDQVMGFLPYFPEQRQGSFAEYVLVKPEECAKYAPSHVKPSEAAALATEYTTALQALRDCGQIASSKAKESAKKVLIVGAGGGLGMAAVQIAKHVYGATVTAYCSERDEGRVATAGADLVVTRESCSDILGSSEDRYDIIFDTPTVLVPQRAVGCLAPDGHLVVTMFVNFKNKAFHLVNATPIRNDLNLLVEWAKEGKIKVPIDTVFDVKDITLAIQRQREKTAGRVVIKVDGGW